MTKSLNVVLGLDTLPDQVTTSGAGSSCLELSVLCCGGMSPPFFEVSGGTAAHGFFWSSGEIMGADMVVGGQYDSVTRRR